MRVPFRAWTAVWVLEIAFLVTPARGDTAAPTASDPTAEAVDSAIASVNNTQKENDIRNALKNEEEEKQSKQCEFDNWGFCAMGGLFVASISATGMRLNSFKGQTSHSIVSFSVPYAGFRVRTPTAFSFDGGVMTGLISKSVSLSETDTACREDAVLYEQKLPCEGNALLRPYGYFFVGGSVGWAGLSAISSYLALGWARTSIDPTAHFFYGLMIGTLGIEKALRLWEADK